MTTASHNVAALSPEAFAPPPEKRSLFPWGTGYSRNRVPPVGRDRRPLGEHAPSCEVLRWPLSLFRGPTRSCFYPRPCAWEPVHDSVVKVRHYKTILSQGWKSGNVRLRARAFHPLVETQGLSSPFSVK
ncbi:MAG: hypothetical protein ACXWOL_13470 [Ktedonobacteraceae bacterium]